MLQSGEHITRLDTLSESALRRTVARWTGELRSVESAAANGVDGSALGLDATGVATEGAEALVGREGVAAVDSFAGEAVNSSVFQQIVGVWREAREVYHDADVEALFGSQSRLSDGIILIEDAPKVVVDSLPMEGNLVGDTSLVEGSRPALESIAGGGDFLAQDRAVEALSQGETLSLDSVVSSAADLLLSPSGVGGVVSEWGELLINLMVVGVVIGYLFCIYRYYDDVVALFGSVFRRNVALSERVDERRRSDIFYGFLGKLFLLGLSSVALLSAEWAYREGIEMGLEEGVAIYAPLVAIALFVVIIVAQYLFLAVVGVVTRSLQTVAALMRIRLIYFVLVTLLVAPMLVISQIALPRVGSWWLWAAVIMAIMSTVLFIRESIELFISKKVSILHWFLYLCTVEILPISLLWQMANRLS